MAGVLTKFVLLMRNESVAAAKVFIVVSPIRCVVDTTCDAARNCLMRASVVAAIVALHTLHERLEINLANDRPLAIAKRCAAHECERLGLCLNLEIVLNDADVAHRRFMIEQYKKFHTS